MRMPSPRKYLRRRTHILLGEVIPGDVNLLARSSLLSGQRPLSCKVEHWCQKPYISCNVHQPTELHRRGKTRLDGSVVLVERDTRESGTGMWLLSLHFAAFGRGAQAGVVTKPQLHFFF
jgi:hypothetical protein